MRTQILCLKKYISAFLSALLIITCFSGCNGDKQTNTSLSIYCPTDYKKTYRIDFIKSLFQTEHPEVEVSYYDPSGGDASMGEEQRQAKMKVDMMAGKGPDVLIYFSDEFIYKMATAGAFCDLKPFMDADETYLPADYHETVMNAGIIDGKQYVLPLDYFTPCLVTTKGILEETGIDPEKCNSFDGFMDEASHYLDTDNPRCLFPNAVIGDYAFSFMPQILDNQNQVADMDTPNYRKAFAVLKKATMLKEKLNPVINYDTITQFADNKQFAFTIRYSLPIVACEVSGLKVKQEPVVLPLYNVDGTSTSVVTLCGMVRSGSTNQQNAYRFLRSMLQENWQSETQYNPVLKSAERVYFDRLRVNGKQWGFIDREELTQQEETQIARASLNNSNPASLRTVEIYKVILPYMEPYLLGNASYEDCVEAIKDRMEIYLSE